MSSPTIAIPLKSTDDVDWAGPIRSLIANSYADNPDSYTTECAALQRCRQDAVKGAGSDFTARDLLYKYFGQLELLELRFSEIRVTFPWRDAFTGKLTTQTSIAYEKASILFQIAATHSAIASSQNRSDPEGLKRAFRYFRTSAGMLSYINENFLHAPSTDLSREVIKFLVGIMIAQATEVFFEKCTEEKKGNALVAKIGAQASTLYNTLCEDVKEFMGKGIFDRNWVLLLQIKAKYFTSLSHYYRGLADNASGKHGDALVRFTLAETLAKEANRSATSFASSFVTTLSPSLPADAGTGIQERTKAHLALCTDKKAEAQRENDLIYNAVLPSPDALPNIEKVTVATPIPIQDVFGSPDVQKVIGPDLFGRLIPLSVHESASVYSEEKAKLVRAEVENAEAAEGESRSVLEGLDVRNGLGRFRAMAEGHVGGEDEVPVDVRRWRDDISLMEEREAVEKLLANLARMKETIHQDLDSVSRDLEIESRDCEMMRVKYEHNWTQEPSAPLTKSIRQDLKAHFEALEAAAASDAQVSELWASVKDDIRILLSLELEDVFRASAERGGASGENLLDLDLGESVEEQERARIDQYVHDIESRLGQLNKIARERQEVLKELKEKVQTDDVSHLLLLNRRNTGVEPALFAAELEKFKPFQQRLTGAVEQQRQVLAEITSLWKKLKDTAGRGPGAKKWEERERRKRDTIRRFSNARDGYMQVKDGLAKGMQFYSELTTLTKGLQTNAKAFVTSRAKERESLAGKLETEQRLKSISSPPPAPPAKPRVPPPPGSLESNFGSMNLGNNISPSWSSNPTPFMPPPPSAQPQYPSSPPPQPVYSSPPTQSPYSFPPAPPPAPPKPASDPYANLGMFSSQFSSALPPPQQPPYNHVQSQPPASYNNRPPAAFPPPPPQPSSYAPVQSPPPPSFQGQPGLPPPPPPVTYQYGQPQQPPYGSQQQGYGGYPGYR